MPAAATLLVALISGTHIGTGVATHGDSRQVIETTVPSILAGGYIPARSYGNPLYEYAVALLYPRGGIWLTSCYSFVLAIASIWVANALIGPRIRTSQRALVLAALCLNPVFLINAFAITEWMQATLLILCLLWCAGRWAAESSAGNLAGMAIFSALLVMTRPDAAIICACLTVALIWHLGLAARRRITALVLAMALAGAVTAVAFVWLNHGLSFLTTGMLWATAPLWRRFIVAVVGVYSSFGILAPLVLIYVAVAAVNRSRGDAGAPLGLWTKVCLLAIPLVFVRYVVMPDKLEYILILLALATAMIGNERAGIVPLSLYALSSLLPSLVTLSLFQRAANTDSLAVHPQLGPGALTQELVAMRYDRRVMYDPATLQSLSDAIYAHEPPPHPRVYSQNWAAGLLSSAGDLIIGEAEAYHLDSPRAEPKYQRRLYPRVFICDHEVWVNGSFGWRNAEPALTWAISEPDGPVNLSCEQEAR